MLSYNLTGFPQCGQWEGGNTMDSSRGSRYMQTFKKLPTIAPRKNVNIEIMLIFNKNRG